MATRRIDEMVSFRKFCKAVLPVFFATVFIFVFSASPGFGETAKPAAAKKDITRFKQADPLLFYAPHSGSQIPAAVDDIMGIQIMPTGTGTFDVEVEFAAADHSDVILLAAMPVANGQHAAGGYDPTPISPGKGRAIVKMKGVYDPFDQLEVYMYLQTDKSVIIKKLFNDYVNRITSVQVTKKTATEYAVGIHYSLASASAGGAMVGAVALKNGEISPSFSSNKPVAAQAGNHAAVLTVKMNSNNPNDFDQFKAAIYSSGDIAVKTVDYGTAAATLKDEIKSFKPASQSITNLNFTVDYAYQSNQSGIVSMTAKALNGGYPIDWIKCTQDDDQKGSGTASLQCNLTSPQTMPAGIQQMESNQVLVQMMRDGSATPLASRTFSFNKTWSIDDLSNFRITGQSGSGINFEVDYIYGSSHGALVGITAKAIAGGVKSLSVFPATQLLSKGKGTVAGKFHWPSNGKSIESVYVYMYEGIGQEFYAATFPYASGSNSSSGAAAIINTPSLTDMDKTVTLDKGVTPAAADGPQTANTTPAYRQIAAAALPPVLNLAAQALPSGEIHLKWTPQAAGVDEYRIERKDAGRPYTVIAAIAPTTAEFADTYVKQSTTYTYRMLAVPKARAAAVVSNEATVTTPAEIKNRILPQTDATRPQH